MHEIHTHPDALEVRPCGPRTYKPHRQRARARLVNGQQKVKPTQVVEEVAMGAVGMMEPDEPCTENLLDRTTLCMPNFAEDSILHAGDAGFRETLRQYFPSAESNASERLVELKNKLRSASTHDFWGILMEEMCDITGSQCGFVAKRLLVDDQDSAVEMPELGEPGSCLMGVAFYVNNGADVKEMYRDYRYHAYGTPCAHMKHDKVFIVPERLTEFVPNNPNPMPWKRSEAFIGVPLFSEGKCFAHFGMLWSSEGASKRQLSWTFTEMLLHALEDMILQRILEGRGFAKHVAPPESTSARVIPLSAITASQSLKPYARSLSHELRTPMQGVVGMLDIMYSTVLDAIANQQNERVRDIFKDLKGHIEVVQDSSKRAVEAADNVVHAYDLNMQMPDTPLTPVELDMGAFSAPSSLRLPFTSFKSGLPSPALGKRERVDDPDFHSGPPLKQMFTLTEAEILQRYHQVNSLAASNGGPDPSMTPSSKTAPEMEANNAHSDRRSSPIVTPTLLSSSQRHVITRDFMRSLMTDALRIDHPISEVHTETALGETVHLKSLSSRGETQERTIYLSVESDVPEVIITEEQHLQFSLQKVIDNAIKFTENGSITINVKLGKTLQVLDIWVVDTGCGISEESRSSLFRPHFQEDASRSRSRDGLGLSLFNAKAHVRKNLGGDVTLERSATDGPRRGSEFLVRLPISSLDAGSMEPPFVGTPKPSSGSQQHNGASADLSTTPNYFSMEPMTRLPSTPARRPSPSRQSSGRWPAFNSRLAKDYPLNILIAEDNAINRNVAMGSLNKLGYSSANIVLAFDGAEAVRHYEASLLKPRAQRFDAILMDIWMPNMDGYEATKRIRELSLRGGGGGAQGEEVKGLGEGGGGCPTILAVTADITGDSIGRAKDAGMQGFLAKPYKVLDIENLIIEHFDKINP